MPGPAMGPVQHPAGLTEAQACGSSARGRPASQQRQEQKAMSAEPPHSTVTEGGRTLEVRWIFPGQLETAVAGWFARFPAGSPGILEVVGRARGRMESWQKWSFPFTPPGQDRGDPAGWRAVRKRRRI